MRNSLMKHSRADRPSFFTGFMTDQQVAPSQRHIPKMCNTCLGDPTEGKETMHVSHLLIGKTFSFIFVSTGQIPQDNMSQFNRRRRKAVDLEEPYKILLFVQHTSTYPKKFSLLSNKMHSEKTSSISIQREIQKE